MICGFVLGHYINNRGLMKGEPRGALEGGRSPTGKAPCAVSRFGNARDIIDSVNRESSLKTPVGPMRVASKKVCSPESEVSFLPMAVCRLAACLLAVEARNGPLPDGF